MSAVKEFNFEKTIGGNVDASVFAIQSGVKSNTLRNITDLTNTKWVFNETGCSGYGTDDANKIFHIDFIYDNQTLTAFNAPYIYGGGRIRLATIYFGTAVYSYFYLRTTDFVYTQMSLTDGEGWYSFENQVYTKISEPPTITITGGTDVTNPDLIIWLTENATLQSATPSMSLGNLSINNIFFGDLEVDKIFWGSVKIYEKEIVPQLTTPNIEIDVDEFEEYNILKIEEVENAEYYDIYVDGVLEESITKSTSKLVRITIEQQYSVGDKDYFRVYDGQDDTGTLLYSDTAGEPVDSPFEVECSSGYLFIDIAGPFVTIDGITVSSGITETSYLTFKVDADGEIAFGTIDYDD